MLLVFIALFAAVAQAQMDSLASNTGQSTHPHGRCNVGLSGGRYYSYAQGFATGDNEDGYTLSEVVAAFRAYVSGSPRVSIYTRSAGTGKPGSRLYTLNNPKTFGKGNVTFTAPPDATLEKETGYFVIFDRTSGGYTLEGTGSNNEDSGGASGWSIANARLTRVGSGKWSANTTFAIKMEIRGAVAGNSPPEFSSTTATRNFDETIGDTRVINPADIGDPLTATDDDGDTPAYTLEGTDAGKFTIDEDTGQIKTMVGEKYSHETKSSYSVTVKADDSNGGTDTIDVTINVDDVTEPPEGMAAPSVSTTSGSTTSLDVVWSAPGNAGRPAITSYDLRYRQGTSGDWTDGPQDVSSTSSAIADLAAGTEYQVQIRATNDEGDGNWSSAGNGSTNAPGNRAPVFTEGADATRNMEETVGDEKISAASDIGDPVTATDDDGDTLTYSLEGVDAGKFGIVSRSGQIRTKVGESYDHETKASYEVIVEANDNNGGSDTITVTVTVDGQDEPPLTPKAPSVKSISGSTTSLDVTWVEPDNEGRPAITKGDLRYREGASGPWTDGPQHVTGTNERISSLTENTEYEVQIRATNIDGDSPWSLPGTGRTGLQGNETSALSTEEEVEEGCTVSDVSDGESLTRFVKCAAKRIEASDTFGETLRLLEEFRDSEGGWNDGSMYLVLLTRRGGVYFHADGREVEDLDWSGLLLCEGGVPVLDTQAGCFIEHDGGRSVYAHPFSASHVPLAHGEDEFVLLGGLDKTLEGKPFAGTIGAPLTEAGEVDTDGELRGFVEDAGRILGEAVENPGIDPAQLRGILRREGPWREGEVYIYVMEERGRVIFDGKDREREQKDESSKQYVRDLIGEADEGIVEYREGGLLIRGYAVRVEAPLEEEDEDSRVYVVGSGYRVEELSGGSDSGGGGCAVGGSGSDGTFGLFMAALGLLLAVSLRSAGGLIRNWQILRVCHETF